MKSIDIRELPLRPLPQETEVLCTHCRVRMARWDCARGADLAFSHACSLCLLYETSVLKNQRQALDLFIGEVERQLGPGDTVPFARDEQGRLTTEADADRIVGGVVLGARMASLMGRSTTTEGRKHASPYRD